MRSGGVVMKTREHMLTERALKMLMAEVGATIGRVEDAMGNLGEVNTALGSLSEVVAQVEAGWPAGDDSHEREISRIMDSERQKAGTEVLAWICGVDEGAGIPRAPLEQLEDWLRRGGELEDHHALALLEEIRRLRAKAGNFKSTMLWAVKKLGHPELSKTDEADFRLERAIEAELFERDCLSKIRDRVVEVAKANGVLHDGNTNLLSAVGELVQAGIRLERESQQAPQMSNLAELEAWYREVCQLLEFHDLINLNCEDWQNAPAWKSFVQLKCSLKGLMGSSGAQKPAYLVPTINARLDLERRWRLAVEPLARELVNREPEGVGEALVEMMATLKHLKPNSVAELAHEMGMPEDEADARTWILERGKIVGRVLADTHWRNELEGALMQLGLADGKVYDPEDPSEHRFLIVQEAKAWKDALLGLTTSLGCSPKTVAGVEPSPELAVAAIEAHVRTKGQRVDRDPVRVEVEFLRDALKRDLERRRRQFSRHSAAFHTARKKSVEMIQAMGTPNGATAPFDMGIARLEVLKREVDALHAQIGEMEFVVEKIDKALGA